MRLNRFCALTLTCVALGTGWLSLHGCGSGSSNPATASGGTGAFGVITVNGKQLLYLPNPNFDPTTGHGLISVIDVGQAGTGISPAPALVTSIDLGSVGDQATTTAGDSNMIVAAGTQTYKVWFINPANNTVTKMIELDPSLNGSSFSGGGGIVNGIAMDVANHRAILSVWDGFLYVDLNSFAVTGSALSAPSENFGFDATRQLILAPFYDCGNISLTGTYDGGFSVSIDAGFCNNYMVLDGGGLITAGLNIVNLATGKVYTYENLTAPDPTHPLGQAGDPDSASVDSALGIAVLPQEYDNQEDFLDLTQAVYDDANLTFTAPVQVVPTEEYDGVAVEPSSHYAFFEEELDDGIALIDMTKLVTGGPDGGVPQSAIVQATMPDPQVDGGTIATWENIGDPHGIAVTTALQGGHPVGFVVSESGGLWVARIDLAKMLSLGQDAGGTLAASDVAPAVTLFDATTQE